MIIIYFLINSYAASRS